LSSQAALRTPPFACGIGVYVREPTEADLLALVVEPACPAVTLRKAPVPARAVFVVPFLDFAESCDFARDETEHAMDAAVAHLGGQRIVSHDPTRRVRNLLRAAQRRPPIPREEVWFTLDAPG
jgi:hypothetical protein